MSVTALSKETRISPRKVGVVASLVRNRTVADALVILDHTPRRAALAVKNTIKSAQANAEHNHNYKPDTLRIIEITVTHGSKLKRFKPVAHGVAHPFIKRRSHIKVVVDGEIRVVKRKTDDNEPKDNKETK